MRPHNQNQSLNLGLAQCPQPKFIEWFGVICQTSRVDQSLLNLINYAFLLMKGMPQVELLARRYATCQSRMTFTPIIP